MQGTMEKLTLKIKKLPNFVSMPEYKTQGASAMDLIAAIDEDIGSQTAFKVIADITGLLKFHFSCGFCGFQPSHPIRR